MKLPSIIIGACGFAALCAFTSEKLVFPTPPDSPKRLFYIQRSNNIHTVIYDANLIDNSHLNPIDPVSIYWIRYADRGQVQPLTYIQRSMAYGIESINKSEGIEIQVVAFKKRKIKIRIIDGQPCALMRIAGAEARLRKIFVQLSDNQTLLPKVAYIELTGKNLKTGEETSERFVP